MVRAQLHQFLQALRAICIIGTAISATTAGLIPWNILITTGSASTAIYTLALPSIIRKGVRQLPSVATRAPLIPRIL